MPREWRFIARSVASPDRCARADARGLLTDVTGAFVDRLPVDWAALLARTRASADRELLENLAFLDRIRAHASPARRRNRWTFVAVRLIAALAAAQTAWTLCAAGITAMSGSAVQYWTPQTAVACAFAAGSALLATAAARDPRGLFLLAAFASAASAFARPAAATLPQTWSAPPEHLFDGLFPEAFIPALLWQFALDFPRARRFTSFDVLARRAAAAAWILGVVLFAVNLSIAYHAIEAGPAIFLGRSHAGGVFWRLFTLALVPAIAAMFVRARRAPAAERRRVARFAYALAAGTGPFLLYGAARIVLPGADEWLAAAAPADRAWFDHLIVAGLASVPMLGTAALVLDRPFALDGILSRRIGRRLAGPVLTAVAAVAFLALAVAAYDLRHTPLADLLRQPQGWFVLACAAAGCALMLVRTRMMSVSGLRGFAGDAIRGDRLAGSLDRIRLARGSREISSVLRTDLGQQTGAATVEILVSDGGRGFVDPLRRTTRLDADAVLISILAEDMGPLDCSFDGPVFDLLPPADRAWVLDRELQLAAPLKRRDGSIAAVVLLGQKRGSGVFDRRDRWLVTTLTTAAAAAWEPGRKAGAAASREPAAGCVELVEEAAYESPGCGRVQQSVPLSCACARDPILAALPRHLGRTFVVQRRIGRGGMGVVYLARDTTLNRDVALKTLPDLRSGAVGQLRNEARAMAGLNHESLETIYGLELWRLTPVLVVEYFPGGTLAQKLARGPLAPAVVVDLGIALARALAYMHSRGMLHRDLKPGNIGFTAAGAPKLLDFGLATLTATSADVGLPPNVDVASGCAGPFTGTPAYLPPEAYEGRPATQAFDLWALSVIMAQALTGLDPIRAQRTESLSETDCPPGLIAFLGRALARDPDLRFSTSAEFLSALAVFH